MGAAPPLGAAMSVGRRLTAGLLVWACIAAVPSGTAAAADRYAVVVTGASGGPPYADRYTGWQLSLAATLRERFRLPADHLFQLAEKPGDGVEEATAANLRQLFGTLRTRMTPDDLLVVVLIGHGTFDGVEAKFNLVGPDLDGAQWAGLIDPLPGRVVFVDTTGGSFPFLLALSRPDRIVLTATDSTAQVYETIFPQFFIKALDDPAADADKDGRVSLWEAFVYASAAVRDWYGQHGQLPTERPILDDNGDKVGTEADTPGRDGALARATFLDAGAAAITTDSTVDLLQKKQAAILVQVEALKARKASMSPDQYEAEFERLMIELARVSQQIRAKTAGVTGSTIPPAPAPGA
ncbi:MAG: hypothetical protein KGN76_09150 [Acidobacteriota bacterium]|nr:hypothetical protein [Acidobacteriota bacterium]